MSQEPVVNQQSEQPGAPAMPPATNTPQPTHPLRLIVLLTIMVCMLGALLYDRFVARPACDNAQLEVEKASEARSLSREPGLTDVEIQQLLGRKPSQTLSGGQFDLEVYRYRGGLPGRTYDYWVVYSRRGDKRFLHTHFSNEEPPPEYMPGYKPSQEIVTETPPDPVSAGGPSGSGDRRGEAGGTAADPADGAGADAAGADRDPSE